MRLSLLVCGMGLVLLCVEARAEKIPALSEISTKLPQEEQTAFRQKKMELEAVLKKFKAASDRFNSKPAKAQNDEEFAALTAELAKNVAAVKQFNSRVAAAMRAITPSSQVAELQNQFQSLSEEIGVDRQVVRNFGFEKTVAEIEYWGNLPARQVEDAKNAFNAMLFDATLGSVSKAAGAVGSLTPEEVDALNRLADAQGAPPLGIVSGANDVHRALEFLDKTKGAYETADAIKKKQMLDAAVKLGGLASKNPAYGLLLTADEWGTYQVYQSAKAVKTVQDLTNVNEGDLILLKSRSEKLKKEVDQLTAVKKQLAKLSSGQDSTTLVRKPE